MKRALGWEPVVPLKEGLALMVEDFANRLGKTGCLLICVLAPLISGKL